MRDGVVRTEGLDQGVKPGDVVMILTTADMIPTLDRLFGARRARTRAKDVGTVDFILEGSASAALVADLYGLDFEPEERALTLEEFMRSRLGRAVKEGARTRVAGGRKIRDAAPYPHARGAPLPAGSLHCRRPARAFLTAIRRIDLEAMRSTVAANEIF